jgi:peptidoglycan/LPS O-acetylase OafA/YrhL
MTIILNNKDLNKSTIIDFYKRRIIRLMPSYVLLLIGVTYMGYYLLSKDSFLEHINQTIYAELLIYNIRILVTQKNHFKEVWKICIGLFGN